jgi:hypothetical protein
MRLVSVVLCLIVGLSFALFAVDQTSNASAHQQRELNNEIPAPAEEPTGNAAVVGTGSPTKADVRESSPRKTIDEVSEAITSPFFGIVESWSSEWLKRGVLLLLTLAIYGFGISFAARAIRVRL